MYQGLLWLDHLHEIQHGCIASTALDWKTSRLHELNTDMNQTIVPNNELWKEVYLSIVAPSILL